MIELKDKLANCAKIVAENADISSNRYCSYFDLKSQDRQLKPGDEVLVLLADSTSKLLVAWSGPYPVFERRNKVNYLIDEKGTPKLYHINLLKKYHSRSQSTQPQIIDERPPSVNEVLDPIQSVHLCVVEDTETCYENDLPVTPDGKVDPVLLPLEVKDPELSPHLTREQGMQIKELIDSFINFFSETPGCTFLIKHDINLMTTDYIKSKVSPIPVHLQPFSKEEVDRLYEQGIIRLSSSPYSSPVVMVRKSDGNYRMAIDYRALNAITVFHAEPACSMEEDVQILRCRILL